jgi:hypothetical protein
MKQTFRETIVVATFLLATGCQPALAFLPSRRDPAFSDSRERSLSSERLFRSRFLYLPNTRVATGFTERLLPLELSRGGASTPPTSTALEETSSSDPSPSSASAYNLIWSPGFLKNLSFATASLVVFHLLGGRLLGRHFFSGARYLASPLASMFPNVLLPFLASACCLLQLAINFVVGAGGCAGFNTYLGPLRPYFLSLQVYLTIISRPSKVSVSLIRFSIAFMPELLHFWNKYERYQWRRKRSSETRDYLLTAIVEIDVPTMGCVACINKIDASVRQCAPEHITSATSWLDPARPKGGRTKVQVSATSKAELNSITQSILKSIEGAGFGGSSVDTIEIHQ